MKNINILTGSRNSPGSDEPPVFAMVISDTSNKRFALSSPTGVGLVVSRGVGRAGSMSTRVDWGDYCACHLPSASTG